MFQLAKNVIHSKLKWWYGEILPAMHGEHIFSGKRESMRSDMPEGMKENDFFPTPIITPSTKAEQGMMKIFRKKR